MESRGKLESVPGVRSVGGEAVFQAPWEARAFGLALSLFHNGNYAWDDFRRHLMNEIASPDEDASSDEYYVRWLAAFESLLEEKGLVTRDQIEAMARTLETAPPPHPAQHPHD